ncbi:MAG TPA: isoprenylcysteine carboxylmethyltransferase family protein [Candidatus Acidoferrales bacterium]|nr:isoprenylcysteine carboxylmethyltransferase family protein [Candidatus Acidoferrales bacterium]
MAWRVFKTLLFTVLVPGTVAGWLPQWLLEEQRRAFPHHFHPSHYGGAILLAMGVAIYLWCAWEFTVTGRGTPAPIDAPRILVVKGLYRWVRNPMYIGVLLVILGQAIFYGSRTILVYMIGVAVLFALFVRLYEEPMLRGHFGEQYEKYRRRVPRWIPRAPGKPGEGQRTQSPANDSSGPPSIH